MSRVGRGALPGVVWPAVGDGDVRAGGGRTSRCKVLVAFGYRGLECLSGVEQPDAVGVLVDDGGRVYTRIGDSGARLVSHGAVGQPLALEPGRDQRLTFLHPGGIEDTLRIQLWHRPRWQEI